MLKERVNNINNEHQIPLRTNLELISKLIEDSKKSKKSINRTINEILSNYYKSQK